MIFALDPGSAGCGVALADPEHKTIEAASYVRNPARAEDWHEDARSMARAAADWYFAKVWDLARSSSSPTLLVAEKMKVYRAGRGKAGADPNDLLKLAAVSGGVAALLPGVSCKSPAAHDWKGTLGDNDQGEYLVELRVRDRLSAHELAAVVAGLPAKSLQHNVWDAAGIALWSVGRGLTGSGRRRVFAP